MWNPLTVPRRNPPTPPTGFKYWAFISYSHKDAAWSNWLHRELEAFTVPPGAPGDIGAPEGVRIYPVFQDREELPTASALNANIEQALASSRHLIVVCSPHAVSSRWVANEIETFKRLGGESRILALIVDGEPNASDDALANRLECFPEPLRYRYDEAGRRSDQRIEPLAADARAGRDGKRSALLKIVAGLLSVHYARLRDRDGRRRARRLAAFAGAGALALAAFAGQQYKAYRDLAEENAATQRALRQSQLRLGDSLLARGVMLKGAGDIAGAKMALAQAYAIQRAAGSSTLPTQLAYLDTQPAVPDPLLLRRMPQRVTALTTTADGCCAVTGHTDGSVRVTDLATGEVRETLVASRAPVRAIDVLAAGGAAVIDAEGAAFHVDRSWRAARPVAGKQPGRLTATAIEARRGLLAVASFLPRQGAAAPKPDEGETLIALFDIAAGGRVRGFRIRGAVSAMAFLRDGESLLLAEEAAVEIILNDALDDGRRFVGKIGGSTPSTIVGHPLVYKYAIDSIAVSTDGRRLALGYSDGILEYWDLESATQLRGVRLLTGSVTSLRALPHGRAFVAATTNGTVHLIDEEHRSPGYVHTDRAVGAAATGDGAMIVSADADWLVVASRPLVRITDHGTVDRRELPPLAPWRWNLDDAGMVPIAAFTADSRLFASHELLSEEVGIWHAASGRKLHTLTFRTNVRAASLVGPGEMLVLLEDGQLFVYDIVGREIRRELRAADRSSRFSGALAVSANRRVWALASMNRLTIGDLEGGSRTYEIGPTSDDSIVRFSGDGKSIALASGKTLTVLATADGRRLASLAPPANDRFAALAISSDGSRLVTGHEDSRIRVWRVGSNEPPLLLKGHTGGTVHALVLLDDDRTVVSGGFNGNLRFWEIDGGSELHAILLDPPIRTLSVSTDGVIAAGVFGDRQVYGDVDLILLDGRIGRSLIEAPHRAVAARSPPQQRAERLLAVAETRRAQGRCRDAIELYDAARREAPFARLHDGLIDCLVRERRPDRAAATLREIDRDGIPAGDRVLARLWLGHLERDRR